MARTTGSVRSFPVPKPRVATAVAITRVFDVSRVPGLDGRYALAVLAEDSRALDRLELPHEAVPVAEWSSPTTVQAMAQLHGRLAEGNLSTFKLIDVLHATFESWTAALVQLPATQQEVEYGLRWSRGDNAHPRHEVNEHVVRQWTSPSRVLLRCVISRFLRDQHIERVAALDSAGSI